MPLVSAGTGGWGSVSPLHSQTPMHRCAGKEAHTPGLSSVQVKGNSSPMKYQEPWQEQWVSSQEPQGQKEAFQTCMESTLGKLRPTGQGVSFTKAVHTNVTQKGSTHLCILLL